MILEIKNQNSPKIKILTILILGNFDFLFQVSYWFTFNEYLNEISTSLFRHSSECVMLQISL